MTTRVLAKDLCEKAFQRLMLRRETFGRGVVLNTAVEFGHVQKTQKTRKLHYVEIYVVKYVHSHIIMYEMIYIKMELGILIKNKFYRISIDILILDSSFFQF